MKTWIVGGYVYRYEKRRLERKNLCMEDGKITKICSPSEEIPEGDIFDVKGKAVVPGFIDVHTHGGQGADVNAATKEDFQKYLDSHEKELESLSESAMAVLNEYCELDIPEKEIEEGEVVDMCKAVREIREEARNEGRNAGKREGERVGIYKGKIEILHELGYTISDIAERLKCTEKEVSRVLATL